MTVAGPLTTTFQAPSTCTTATPLFQVWSGKQSSYVGGPLYTSGSDCFPTGYDPSPSNYYSPGWCPYGYTTACSSLASASTATETAVICCPTQLSFTCPEHASSGQQSLGCTTTWGATVLGVLGATVVTDGKVGTKTTVSVVSGGITAYGIQVRFKSGDPTAMPTSGDSGISVKTQTSTPSVSIPTQLFIPAQTSAPASGLSTPAVIGIGVGSAVGVLLLAVALGLFFFMRRRRRKREEPEIPSAPPPVPPKELPGSPVPYGGIPPPYELSDQSSPRRASTFMSKSRYSVSPALGARKSKSTVARGDSEVFGAAYEHEPVELEAELPSHASLRDRASPESASTGWTERQARGGTSPFQWI